MLYSELTNCLSPITYNYTFGLQKISGRGFAILHIYYYIIIYFIYEISCRLHYLLQLLLTYLNTTEEGKLKGVNHFTHNILD